MWDVSNDVGWPEEQVYVGLDATLGFLRGWREIFADYEFVVARLVEAGDRVVILCHQTGFGELSHAPVTMQFAQILTVRDGLVVRVDTYSDQDAALAAIGAQDQLESAGPE